MVVLTHKGNVDFRGIGLVKVLRKTMSGMINHHIGAEFQFHNVLHGFWEGWGKENASLEAKLNQKLTETM